MKKITVLETEKDAPTATVKDFSDGKDGSTEVTVKYGFEYDELETETELQANFAVKDLIKLANQRNKATANSGARQKAIAKYAIDPNTPAATKERMVKDAIKLGMSVEKATAFVDSLIAAV